MIVAGGGGGGCNPLFLGGNGGGLVGGNGIGNAGQGGTQVSGGSGFSPCNPGGFGFGGNSSGVVTCGGGGGGFFGGGSGCGAGGGSSFLGGVINGNTITGVRVGDGMVVLSWTVAATEISLSPTTATNDLLTNHTVLATIEAPAPDVLVTFEVISGPNAGLMSMPNSGECSPNDCATDSNGQVSWTYKGGKIPGTDIIVASFFDEQFQVSIESNLVEKIWESIPIPTLSEWGLIAMATILGIVGFMVIRRRKLMA